MRHHSDGPSLTIQVTGLVHDLGKLLHFFGSEGQWDVVGVSDCFHLSSPNTLSFAAAASFLRSISTLWTHHTPGHPEINLLVSPFCASPSHSSIHSQVGYTRR